MTHIISTAEKIVDAVSLVVFIPGILGLLSFGRNSKEKIIFLCLTTVIAMMFLWRLFFSISSSRYAIVFLYFFVFSASCFAVKTCERFVKKQLFFWLFALLFIAPLFIKILKTTQANQSLIDVAEAMKHYDNTGRYLFLTEEKDYPRIKYYSGLSNASLIHNSFDEEKILSYVNQYNRSKSYVGVDLICKTGKPVSLPQKINKKNRQFVSVFSQKHKKNQHCIFVAETNIQCRPVSPNEIKDLKGKNNNILQNGDFEEIDTPEDSYKKLKNHIVDYVKYYDFNPETRTPKNAYFHNGGAVTKTKPYYNCSSKNPICGKYSSYLKINNGIGSLLFYQKFSNGKYNVSFLARGKAGTQICLVCDRYINNTWKGEVLIQYTLESSSLYYLETTFSVSDLKSSDYFLLAVSVENGEAYFDDFFLSHV